ncbi:MAG: putative permease [Phenylobacterium sp.]|nr:putative permease [Phenylobacterium sp.]
MAQPALPVRPTRVRHIVLWLTVAAYMITYMDRVVISIAAPSIQKEMGLSLITMGWVFGAFQLSYALFQIPGGWLGDRYGPRRVLTGIVVWWSAFTAATALTWSAGSLIVCRFLFGAGEAGAFPNATRSLSRWMLPSERGFAQGLTHAGARLGSALTPVLVVLLIAKWGWRTPFFAFAGLGLVWAAVWFWFYRDTPEEHRQVNAGERALIEAGLGGKPVAGGTRKAVPWGQLLSNPQIWVLSAMYACYAYVMAIFLTWFPKYLVDARHFSLKEMGFYASLPLLAAVVGDVAGGTFSDRLFRWTGRLNFSRRAVAIVGFLLASGAIPPAVLAASPLVGVGFFCLALFGLELTVGVSWAVTLDIGGEFAGSVSSIMNTFGNIAGASAAALTGYIVTAYGWDAAFLVLAGLCLLAALLFIPLDCSKRIYAEGPALQPA